VAALIRQQVFWEPKEPVPLVFQEYRAIYQENRFTSEAAQEDDDEDEEGPSSGGGER